MHAVEDEMWSRAQTMAAPVPTSRFSSHRKTGVVNLYRGRFMLAVATVVFSVILASCGGSGGPQANSTSPGSGDKAICNVVAQATVAYNAKQYETWSSYMAQIGNMANSAQYTAIKDDAKQLQQAYDTPAKRNKTKSIGDIFKGLGGIAGYVGLKNTCAKLHL